jgi:1-acyl-sn-glycerol-3-phosphate acyltransferase
MEKFVDIDNIVAEKAKSVPGFLRKMIASYLKRIAHQDEVNDALFRYKDRYEGDFADAAFEEFSPNLEVVGLENVPTSGGCIIAANHPLGGLDGIVMMHVIGGQKKGIRKDIRFIVNDLLMHLKNFGSYFIPVNKLGKNPAEYLQKIEEIYASDDCILIFPAGLCSRKQEEGIMDLEWKKSFISKAVKHKKDIVPCFIEGRNSSFFYNLAKIRAKLGIKFNIEMMYLADEMYQQRGKKIKFVFGKPIPWQTFDRSKNPTKWAEEVKAHVYALGGKGDLRF